MIVLTGYQLFRAKKTVKYDAGVSCTYTCLLSIHTANSESQGPAGAFPRALSMNSRGTLWTRHQSTADMQTHVHTHWTYSVLNVVFTVTFDSCFTSIT